MTRRVITVLLAMILLIPGVAGAQGNTGALAGAVRDQQRLPVPGATVTVTGTESGLTRTGASGADGTFEFAGLQPGPYLLAAEFAGFERRQLQIVLAVNQRVRVEMLLLPSGVQEQVDVQATVPLLHTTDVAIGEVIDSRQIAELPLNGRQFLELALLVPGVHTSHGAQTGSTTALYWRPGQNSAISVSGGRPNSNVYLLDGTMNTDPSFNTYVISLPQDSIREFQIQTGTYTAELGGAGTGQVNVVTKSGTGTMHGTLYEFFRNDAFDSRPFNNPDELPPFTLNQYGGTLGGPAGLGRTFFFGNFEGFRSRQGQSEIRSVPLEAWRRGDFSGRPAIYDPFSNAANPNFDPTRPSSAANPQFIRTQFPNNQIPFARMNPVALEVLQKHVALPNLPGLTNNYLDTRVQQLDNDSVNVRIDRTWASSSLLARYSLNNEDGYTPENLPGFGAFHDNRVQNFSGTYIRPISKNLLSESRFGFLRMRLHRYGESSTAGTDYISQLNIPGVGFGGADAYGLPRFDVQGYTGIGDSLLCTPCRYWNNQYQLGERLIWTKGEHSLRFGGDYRKFNWDMLGFFQNRGYFQITQPFTSRTSFTDGTGDPLASMLLGVPALAQRQAGTPSMKMRQNAFDLFVQDDWRVTSSVTINAGLRYELQKPLADISKLLTNLDFIDGKPLAYVGGQNDYPLGLAWADRNNVAPRLGVAWAPGEARSVLRGGYGVFFAYSDMSLWCNQVHNVPLVFPEIRASNALTPTVVGYGFAPPVLGQTLVAFTALDPHAQTPMMQQASASFERQLKEHLMVQVGYLGVWGSNFDRSRLVNNAQPGPGGVQPRRPNQTISFVPNTVLPPDTAILSTTFPVGPINLLENTGTSEYNSAWVLTKRTYSAGLSFLASYTYAVSYSDAPAFRSPASESEVPQDSFRPELEWGPNGCDIRHRFVSSVLFHPPYSAKGGVGGGDKVLRTIFGDWQVAFIYQAQSGFPYTIGVFGDTANAGTLLNVNPIRADVVPGVDPNLPSNERDEKHWFNTAAFRTPAAFTFGTATRNSMVGPALVKADLSLQRQFPIGSTSLDLRVETFNLFNRSNFAVPERFVNTPQFGTITVAATPARQVQFAARLSF